MGKLAIAVVVALVIGLGAGWYYVAGAPQYSLYLLALAFQDRDEAAIARHFDVEQVAADAADLVWATFREKGGLRIDSRAEAMIRDAKPQLGLVIKTAARQGAQKVFGEAFGPVSFPFGLVTVWQRAGVARDGASAGVALRGPGGKDVHLWMATKPGQGWRVVVFDRAGLARALDETLK
ncbi:MAG: DUF2939 domain-containing protein [Candidatus Rokubacteria bacterium]|nr:DUF2939 domain-containing protein [Candidatus Rokubacteria bacterium]